MAVSNPFITVSDVVANSASIIPQAKQDPRLRNLMRQWTYLGERQLGFSGLHEKVSDELTVTNLVITKPADYACGIDIALLDDEGSEYRWHFRNYSEKIHANTVLFSNSQIFSVNNNVSNEIGLSETAYTFQLESTGTAVTKAVIRYYSYPIDDNGDMLIPEHHLIALMAWNRWMASLRDINSSRAEREENQNLWRIERGAAKSKNKIPSMLEGRDINRFHASMIDKIFYERY